MFGSEDTTAQFDVTEVRVRMKGAIEIIEGIRESSLNISKLIKDNIKALYRKIQNSDAENKSVEKKGVRREEGCFSCPLRDNLRRSLTHKDGCDITRRGFRKIETNCQTGEPILW